ncbi:T-lymphocyte surface antigen Ly-9 isoform 4-T4 [Trichechus inunguis]
MANPKRYTDDCALGPFSTKSQKTLSYIFSPTLWTPLLFLLMAAPPSPSSVSAELRTSGEEAVPTEVIGTLGGFMTLPLNISVGTEIEHVAWNGPQKTLALASPAGALIILDKSYQSRLSISSQSYSLSISKLTPKDEGIYRAQINRKNSNITIEERFVLHIYEQLQKPRVTVKHTMSESTSCNLTLVCSVERAEKSVLYSWTWVDTHSFKSFESSTLTISWMPCDPDVAYTCTAKNPVSQSTSSPVHAQQFCADLRASRGRTVGETVVGTLGESVTLSLTVPVSRDIEKVVWMFNTSIISKDWREPAIAGPLMKSKEPGKDRVWVSDQDYTLKISQLKMEDTGPYNAYLCLNTPRLTSTQHFTLRVYRSAPAFNSSQVEAPADLSGCKKLDTPPKTARQWPRTRSNNSSDSNLTTEEDKETTEMQEPVSGRDMVYDLGLQEDTASNGQAEYDLVTPNNTVPESVAEVNTVYAQVFFNSKGKTPVPQKKDSSYTVYCSVQKPQLVRTIFSVFQSPRSEELLPRPF